jgi:putative acetyltransferase
MLTLQRVTDDDDLAAVRLLFREYVQAADAPECFAGFEYELAALPEGYAALFLAKDGGAPAGCAAMRRLDGRRAEMKRLYVRPGHRGKQLGRRLTQEVIDAARQAGFSRLLLDTLPQMDRALALYLSLGFTETGAYLAEPTPGARCFELKL